MPFVFKENRAGIAEIARSAAVVADLRARAERVAAKASSDDAEYHVHTEVGRRRARAAVVTGNFKAMLAEHREHRLASAIDAARG